MQFLDWLIARVYGHYAHPYTIQFTLPHTSIRRGYEMEFIGTYKAVVDLAKRQIRAGKAANAVIRTRSGYKVWEWNV